MRLKIVFIGLTFLLLARIPVWPNSTADFLLGNVDARTHSLGGAVAGDVNGFSTFSRNPSSLSISSSTSFSSSIGIRPDGSKNFQFSFTKSIKGQNIGLHVFNSFYQSETMLDDIGNPGGEFKNSDLSILFALGREIKSLRFGISTVLVRKSLADISAQGASVTGSIQVPVHRRFMLGVLMNDVTLFPISFDGSSELFPSQARAGTSFRVIDRDNFTIDFLNDLVNSSDQGLHYELGSELNLNSSFFVRGGISSVSEGGRIGLGLWFERFRLDWSMQFSPLGSRDFMNFTVGYKF